MWRLLAILESTMRLRPEISRWLYHAAVALHESGETGTRLDGDLAEGQLCHLQTESRLGVFYGPCFEARLEMEEGEGRVRFLVTREGLAALEEGAETPSTATPLPTPRQPALVS